MMKTSLIAGFLMLGGLAAAVNPLDAQERERRIEIMTRASDRGWLGISFRPGDDPNSGVNVEQVVPGTPAAQAGLREGDRVVRWNGRADVTAAVRESAVQPGDTVRITVARAGEANRELALVATSRAAPIIGRRGDADGDVLVFRSGELARLFRVHGDSLLVQADSLHARLRVMLRDSLGPRLEQLERTLPDARIRIMRDSAMMEAFGSRPGGAYPPLLSGPPSAVAGAELADLRPGLASYFGTERGVLVLRVPPETPAARAGLQEGDVIVRVADDDVNSVAEFRRAVAAQRGGAELEVVRRGVRERFRLGR